MMKLFLASFALLASVSTVSVADEHLDTLIITSTPHAVGKTGNDIAKQYEWINKFYPDALGVVVNGDLTGWGSSQQVAESKRLLSQLEVPYFLGLGDNDYLNNISTNYSRDSMDNVMWLSSHVEDIRKQGREVNFDFLQQSGYGYLMWLASTDAMGSLGYGVDLGKVYLIQLNESTQKEKFPIKGTNHSRYYSIQVNPVRDWLESTLEYAAQKGKIIIVNKHTAILEPEIVHLLDYYDVRLRFASYHDDAQSKFACQNNGFTCLGFSPENEVLRVILDYDKNNYSVANILNLNDSSPTQKKVGPLNVHPSHALRGTYPNRNLVMSVKNSGGYVANVRIKYKGPSIDSNCKLVDKDGRWTGWTECNSAAMNLGNVYMVDLPKNASEVSASFLAWTGKTWDPTKEVFFNETNLEQTGASSLCYTAWGTTWSPKYSRQESNLISSKNSC